MATLSRRGLLIGGGAGAGLVVAWALWPRAWPVALTAAPGETILGPFLKIARDGQVTVAVPQAEHGQGVYTTLAQVAADELGADWRMVAVEAAPPGPAYANPLAAAALFGGGLAAMPDGVRDAAVRRDGLVLTAASTSIRRFEEPLRRAGAAARVLLCKAAARRWDADWQACDTADGFVTLGVRRIAFGTLAEAAARETLPDELPLRFGSDGRLSGRPLPRLDTPSKVAGAANFAADIRLPDMVFASIRQGPPGDTRLLSANVAAAERIAGVVSVLRTDRWVAAVANSWWMAERAAAAVAPRFATAGMREDGAAIERALAAAMTRPGQEVARSGDAAAAIGDRPDLSATFTVAAAPHPGLEPPCATAHWHGDRLELWCATQAPGAARDAAAAAIGVDPGRVTVHPLMIGGGFGAALETDVAAQAAWLAVAVKRPVQLMWSHGETRRHDRVRAPARAHVTVRLGEGGAVAGWHARLAAPATGAQLARRLLAHDPLVRAAWALPVGGDGYAVSGAVPPYRVAALAIDHHPADLALETGHLRGGADGHACFVTESVVDDLARAAGGDPLGYRLRLLGDRPRLARCLSTAAALAGWDGGQAGSRMGIACHMMAGSFVAVVAEASRGAGGNVAVARLSAAVDAGRVVNPDVVRQTVEGGLILGAMLATGNAPALAGVPEVSVELIGSEADPGGVSDLAVPPVAPAIANALRAATGTRPTRLPLSAHP